MPKLVNLTINGSPLSVSEGTNVAAAVIQAVGFARQSVSHENRAPLCGMGICYECRVTVNGRAQVRGCLVICEEGMEVETSA